MLGCSGNDSCFLGLHSDILKEASFELVLFEIFDMMLVMSQSVDRGRSEKRDRRRK